jgi:hypothetical protein
VPCGTYEVAQLRSGQELVTEIVMAFDPASYPHASGVYNLMMSGGEYGSQKGRRAEPSVHE